MTAALLLLVLSQASQPYPLRLKDEGATRGWVDTINCVGTGVECTRSGGTGTVTISGGGGAGLPADPTACGANLFVVDQNASGVLMCTQPAFSNLSGTASASQLPAPGATTRGGVEAETCSGNDKVSAINTDGTVTCSADQTGAGGGAPTDATYITQTAHASLSAEQALSGLTTGIVKVTNGTGALSTAVAGDFPTLNQNTTGTAAALAANPADCSAGQYATTIAASGALACAQVAYGQLSGTPTIPPDVSAAPIVTTAADSSLSNEKVLPTCAGNDKLTFNGTTISCAADQTSAGGSGPTVVRVSADVSNSTTSFANVTGLTHTVSASTTYAFTCELSHTTAVSTTALQVSVNGTVAATALDYCVTTGTSATATHRACQTAYDTVTNPATGAAAVVLPVRISGTVVVGGAGGTLAVRLRSEVAASAVTVKRGSWCQFHQL